MERDSVSDPSDGRAEACIQRLTNHQDPPGCQPLSVVLVDGLDLMITAPAAKMSSLSALLMSAVISPVNQNHYGNESDLVLSLFFVHGDVSGNRLKYFFFHLIQEIHCVSLYTSRISCYSFSFNFNG